MLLLLHGLWCIAQCKHCVMLQVQASWILQLSGYDALSARRKCSLCILSTKCTKHLGWQWS
jgi:hypothetical protein